MVADAFKFWPYQVLAIATPLAATGVFMGRGEYHAEGQRLAFLILASGNALTLGTAAGSLGRTMLALLLCIGGVHVGQLLLSTLLFRAGFLMFAAVVLFIWMLTESVPIGLSGLILIFVQFLWMLSLGRQKIQFEPLLFVPVFLPFTTALIAACMPLTLSPRHILDSASAGICAGFAGLLAVVALTPLYLAVLAISQNSRYGAQALLPVAAATANYVCLHSLFKKLHRATPLRAGVIAGADAPEDPA